MPNQKHTFSPRTLLNLYYYNIEFGEGKGAFAKNNGSVGPEHVPPLAIWCRRLARVQRAHPSGEERDFSEFECGVVVGARRAALTISQPANFLP